MVSKRIKDSIKEVEKLKKEMGSDEFLKIKKQFNIDSCKKTILLLDFINENRQEDDSTSLWIGSIINVLVSIAMSENRDDFKEFCHMIDIMILQLQSSKERENLHEVRRPDSGK